MKPSLPLCLSFALLPLFSCGCTSPSINTRVQAVDGSTAQAGADNASQQEAFVLPTRSCGNYFIVDAMVDGKGPFPMLLDTGASTTTISPSMSQATGASNWIHSFQVGRFHATGNIECQVQELAHLGRALGVEIHGIVSYGMFEGMLLTYDFPAKQIRLEKRSFTANEISKPNVVRTSTGKRPYVRVSAGSVEFTALVDTGSSRNLTFRKLERFSFEEPPIPTGGTMKVGGLYLVESGRVDYDIQVGPLTLSHPIVNSAHGTSLFGQGLMRNFVVTFDQVQHYVRFEKPHGSWQTPIESPPLFGTGMIANPKDDRLVVRRVFEGSAAHRAGLLVNDEILARNGVPIADRDCSLWDSRNDSKSTPVDLLVLRDGRELQVKFSTDVLVK